MYIRQSRAKNAEQYSRCHQRQIFSWVKDWGMENPVRSQCQKWIQKSNVMLSHHDCFWTALFHEMHSELPKVSRWSSMIVTWDGWLGPSSVFFEFSFVTIASMFLTWACRELRRVGDSFQLMLQSFCLSFLSTARVSSRVSEFRSAGLPGTRSPATSSCQDDGSWCSWGSSLGFQESFCWDFNQRLLLVSLHQMAQDRQQKRGREELEDTVHDQIRRQEVEIRRSIEQFPTT